jgi:S1-C subfamily serine protease
MKIIKSLLLVSLLFTISQARGKKRDFSAIIDEAHQGIAAVVVPGEGGIGITVGTAFFVSDEYLITAAHVVRGQRVTGLYVPAFEGGTTRIIGSYAMAYETVEISDEYDVALLRIVGKARRAVKPFILAIGTLHPGREVAVTGFGSLADFPLTFTGFVASQGSMHFGAGLRQAQRRPTFGEKSSVFVIDRPIPAGFSGSPVYLRDTGVVYGIAAEIRPDLNSNTPAMSLAHPLVKAKEFLDKHKIAYRIVAPEDAFVNP